MFSFHLEVSWCLCLAETQSPALRLSFTILFSWLVLFHRSLHVGHTVWDCMLQFLPASPTGQDLLLPNLCLSPGELRWSKTMLTDWQCPQGLVGKNRVLHLLSSTELTETPNYPAFFGSQNTILLHRNLPWKLFP